MSANISPMTSSMRSTISTRRPSYKRRKLLNDVTGRTAHRRPQRPKAIPFALRHVAGSALGYVACRAIPAVCLHRGTVRLRQEHAVALDRGARESVRWHDHDRWRAGPGAKARHRPGVPGSRHVALADDP